MKKKKEIVQCSFRIRNKQMEALKKKTHRDGINIQKFGELMVKYYLKDHKPIMSIVEKYVQENTGKKKAVMDEIEVDKLLEIIENEFSPLRDVEKALEEIRE